MDPMALTVKEACVVLGNITPPTFYKLVKEKKLRTFRIGTRRLVTPEAINEYIENQEIEG